MRGRARCGGIRVARVGPVCWACVSGLFFGCPVWAERRLGWGDRWRLSGPGRWAWAAIARAAGVPRLARLGPVGTAGARGWPKQSRRSCSAEEGAGSDGVSRCDQPGRGPKRVTGQDGKRTDRGGEVHGGARSSKRQRAERVAREGASNGRAGRDGLGPCAGRGRRDGAPDGLRRRVGRTRRLTDGASDGRAGDCASVRTIWDRAVAPGGETGGGTRWDHVGRRFRRRRRARCPASQGAATGAHGPRCAVTLRRDARKTARTARDRPLPRKCRASDGPGMARHGTAWDGIWDWMGQEGGIRGQTPADPNHIHRIGVILVG